jgi:hypothetical protein
MPEMIRIAQGTAPGFRGSALPPLRTGLYLLIKVHRTRSIQPCGRRFTMEIAMMTRRQWWIALLPLAACDNRNEQVEILPMTLGEWRRVSVENMPPEEHSEELKQRGIKRARRAYYEANGVKLAASVYEYGSQAVAFELVQKWRPEPRKMAFHQGTYFVVLSGGGDDNKVRNDFAARLEASLQK